MEDFVLYILKINILAALLIILALAVSAFLSRKYSFWWRSWFWLLVAVVLLLPVQIPDTWNVIHIQYGEQSVSPEKLSSDMQLQKIENENPTDPGALNLPSAEALSSYKVSINGNTIAQDQGFDITRAANIFLIVWISGTGVYLLYRIFGSHVIRRELKRWSMPVPDKSLQMNYQKLCKEIRLRRIPRLQMNAKLTTPLLSGLLRPCIYLPSDQFTKKELELLLKHEVSHYQHRDLWYKLILQLACMVYWFNPALHLMKHVAEQDLEFLCDERVMKDGTHEERMQYNYLLAQTAVRSRSFYGLSTGFNGDLANLKKRMVNIMKAGKKKKGAILTLCFVAVFLLLNVMTGCSVKKPQDTPVDAGGVSDSKDREPIVKSTPEETLETTPVPTQGASGVGQEPTIAPTVIPPEPETTEPEPTEPVGNNGTGEVDDTPENVPETENSGDAVEPVQAKINVYEGEYNQSNLYSGAPGTANEGYIVKVTNVTDNSFDFTIYLYTFDPDTSIQNEELVFKTHTAVFIDDGTKAVYDGIDYDLTFTFPDYHSAYPEATDMEISGYAPVEGETFMNNQIPGHGFS